jgi:anti-sigma factor RsiW
MKDLTCAATGRMLDAFHDEELPFAAQIAVGAHLEWCDSCAASLADLRLMREALRGLTPGRQALSRDEEVTLQTTVVNRIKAERSTSWNALAREMFEDMHMVYAGAGAALAAVVCIASMFALMQFGTRMRPDSLAAMIRFAAPPGSNQNPVRVGARMQLPRALNESIDTSSNMKGDTAFMLAAVVTREGTISNLEVLPAMGGAAAPGSAEARAVENLLGSVSRARFEPARLAGLPVAANVVWLVTHTTVRGSQSPDLPATPAGKKRTASIARPDQPFLV